MITIIRTIDQLKALDPKTNLLGKGWPTGLVTTQADWVQSYEAFSTDIFPLAVLLSGSDLDAASEALEKENEK